MFGPRVRRSPSLFEIRSSWTSNVWAYGSCGTWDCTAPGWQWCRKRSATGFGRPVLCDRRGQERSPRQGEWPTLQGRAGEIVPPGGRGHGVQSTLGGSGRRSGAAEEGGHGFWAQSPRLIRRSDRRNGRSRYTGGPRGLGVGLRCVTGLRWVLSGPGEGSGPAGSPDE